MLPVCPMRFNMVAATKGGGGAIVMQMKSEEEFALSASNREREFSYRRQAVNWLALASVGGVATLLSALPDGERSAGLRIIYPSIALFCAAIITCGILLLCVTHEARLSAKMWARAGCRDRCKEQAALLAEGSPDQITLLDEAKAHAEAEARHHGSAAQARKMVHWTQLAAAAFLICGLALPLIQLPAHHYQLGDATKDVELRH